MIKGFFKKSNLGLLGLVVGMALIGGSSPAIAGCCATDAPGPKCGPCCEKKWKGKPKGLAMCKNNCNKGNCKAPEAGADAAAKKK